MVFFIIDPFQFVRMRFIERRQFYSERVPFPVGLARGRERHLQPFGFGMLILTLGRSQAQPLQPPCPAAAAHKAQAESGQCDVKQDGWIADYHPHQAAHGYTWRMGSTYLARRTLKTLKTCSRLISQALRPP